MGTRAKNDKLDLIASIFEGNNCASFNMCCEDLEFKKLLIENATRPTGEIVKILSNYANENLIQISLIDCHPTQGGNPLRLIPILTTAFGGLYNEKEK